MSAYIPDIALAGKSAFLDFRVSIDIMQPSDNWDNRFWKEKIPRYNAILDKHCSAYRRTCLRPRTSSTDHSKPPLIPSKSSAVHESVLAQVLTEIEQAWKLHRIPEENKRMYRAMFARMNNQEVVRFVVSEVPRLQEGSALVQQALAAIETREEQLTRVKKVVARLGLLQVEVLQWKLAEAISTLRAASLQAAELIFTLIDHLKSAFHQSVYRPEALSFPWQERDYIAKMTTDLGFFRKPKVSRLLNAGSSADPMLLSTALKPPDNHDLVTYTGKEKFLPQVIEGKLVVPVLRKDVERLLYVNTRLAKECGLPSIHAVRPPPERGSATNSRFGASADPAKPILPLRLKVLIQRFQTAATDEESSAYHTRAASQMEDSREVVLEEVVREVEGWAVGKLVEETVVCELREWYITDLVSFELIDTLLFDTINEENIAPTPSLPILSEIRPIQPTLSPISCYEDQLPTLIHAYYQHLPASLLNLSEKAGHLCSQSLHTSQPSYHWILSNNLLCGLVIWYRDGMDTVIVHLSTLEEEWYSLVLPCVLGKVEEEKGDIVVPLHAWNGDEGEIEKYAEVLRKCGFETIFEGKFANYKRVYGLKGQNEVDFDHITLQSDPSNSAIHWYIPNFNVSLVIPSFEIRDHNGISYIRFKSAVVSVSNTSEKQVKVKETSGNYEFLFISTGKNADLSSFEAITRLIEGKRGEIEGEIWVPGFKKQGISLFGRPGRGDLLGVRPAPMLMAFPFVFAVTECTSSAVLCATYVNTANDLS